jgi:hypothetical protein
VRNVEMIRREQGLIWIRVEKAVYCDTCETVSTSAERRCGLCGSEKIVRLALLMPGPRDPSPAPALALAA